MSYTYLSLFSGMGGQSLGFQQAGWTCVGAVDSSPSACQVYEYITGHPATCGDLETMSPADLRAVCSGRPDAVISSPPCQGNSGCLPAAKAEEPKYQALNTLAFRGIWLALEAWPNSPPPLILIENVPRITIRSRSWLDQLEALLRSHGYACKETFHDCGELGGLAQHRKRFLLVARHMAQVPEFLYEPPKRRVLGIGEVLSNLPVPTPTNTEGAPMHNLPRMSPLNWLRLALIPAGKDWRALPEKVALAARATRQNGGFGVNDWERGSHSVLAEGTIGNTWASTSDPRVTCEPRPGSYGVLGDEPAPTVIGHSWPDRAAVAMADPRLADSANRHNGKEADDAPAHTVLGDLRTGKGWAAVVDPRVDTVRREGGHGVKGWDQPSTPLIGHGTIHNHPSQVADPRVAPQHHGNFGVEGWGGSSGTVKATHDPKTAKSTVADPRLTHAPRKGSYGMLGWAQPSHVIRGVQRPHNGFDSVADPRLMEWLCEGPELDLKSRRGLHLVIRAFDGTWHRPMTDLELAVLQGFPAKHRGGWLNLPCLATSPSAQRAERRQHIGNAIPPLAAAAIARVMAVTLDAARDGGLLLLGQPVWVDGVRP